MKIPVIVNGDVKTADDAARALAETACEGVMVGRRAIEHPWVFREIYGLLRRGEHVPPPTDMERIELCKEHLVANVAILDEWVTRTRSAPSFSEAAPTGT